MTIAKRQMWLSYIPCSNEDEAKSLAMGLIEGKFAACVHRFPVYSTYKWDNKICDAQEWVLLVKTSKNNIPLIDAYILKHHSYEIPAIICWEAEANSSYTEWLHAVL